MIPLTDILARYHAKLAAERVDTDRGTLLGLVWSPPASAGGPQRVRVEYDGEVSYPMVDRLFLPLTPRNVRALAAVLAEAVGLDATQGAIWRREGVADFSLRVATPGGLQAGTPPPSATTRRFVDVVPNTRHDGLWVCVPSLRTINPNAPDALGHALVACLRAVAEEA